MIVILRFVGVMNAALWFGGALFFTLAIRPAFSSLLMRQYFNEAWAGVIGQIIAERYYGLFYCCGTIAIVHQLAEWLYLGKNLQRLTLLMTGGIFFLGLVGGFWFQPKLNQLHEIRYARPGVVPPAQQAQAARRFGWWNGAAVSTQWLALAGLMFYVWRVSSPPPAQRFISTNKFRS